MSAHSLQWRRLDADAVSLDVTEVHVRFRVVAIKPSGVRALVVSCGLLEDAEACAAMLHRLSSAVGGAAFVEECP